MKCFVIQPISYQPHFSPSSTMLSSILPPRDPSPEERRDLLPRFKKPIVYDLNGNVDFFATVGQRPLTSEEILVLISHFDGDCLELRDYVNLYHGKKYGRALHDQITELGFKITQTITPFCTRDAYKPSDAPPFYFDSCLPLDQEEAIDRVLGTKKLVRLITFLRTRSRTTDTEPIGDICDAVESAGVASKSQFRSLLDANAFESIFSVDDVEGVETAFYRVAYPWDGHMYSGCPPAFVVADLNRCHNL